MTPQEAKTSIDRRFRQTNQLYHRFAPFFFNEIYSLVDDKQWLVFFSPQKQITNTYDLDALRRAGMHFTGGNRYKYAKNKSVVRVECYLNEKCLKLIDNKIVVECRINFTDKETYWEFLPGDKYDYILDFYLEDQNYFEIKQQLNNIILSLISTGKEEKYYPPAVKNCFNRPIWEVSFEECRNAFKEGQDVGRMF